MTNTILFDLQAAAAAMAANPGQIGTSGDVIPADGVSFSDILAAQTNTVAGAVNGTNGTDTEITVTDGTVSGQIGTMLEEAIKKIEAADDGVKKAMKLLLKTVIDAMRGARDGEKRKTDMFMILSDGSAGLFDDEDENDVLLGAEIFDRLGIILGNEDYAKTDSIFDGLDRFISSLFDKDDDDTDENTAAEVLAAMMNVQPEDIGNIRQADEEIRTEAVGNAAQTLRTAMETIVNEAPEKAEKAEELFAEFGELIDGKVSEEAKPEIVSVSFAAVNISNAAEQVSSIAVKGTDEELPEDEAAAEETVVMTDTVQYENAVQTEGTVRVDEAAEANVAVAPKSEVKAEVKVTDDVKAASETEVKNEVPVREVNAEVVTVTADIEPAVFDRSIPEADTEFEVRTAVSVENQITERIGGELEDIDGENGTKELVLILRPRELGQVAVKLIKENGEISVMLSAQYSEVGKLMTQRAEHLGSSLSNQNTVIKDVQVVEPGNAAEQMGLSFTEQGFSFARNASQDGSDRRNGSYGETDDIGEIEAVDNTADMREARKLWTTA